jgi:hypothetical protein
MDHYTTTTGEVISFATLAPNVVEFLRRAIVAAKDPNVSKDELATFIFGAENPLLDRSILPGRGVVRKALHESALHVMFLELIARGALAAEVEDALEATRQRVRPLALPRGDALLPPSAQRTRK